MKEKIYVAVLAAVVAGVVGFASTSKVVVDRVVERVGGSSGTSHSFNEEFNANIIRGGVVSTTTNVAAATLLSTDIIDVSRLNLTPLISGVTYTTPASSTLTSFVPKSGDTANLIFCSGSTYAFTLAFGTGMTVHNATSTLVTTPQSCGTMTFSRATTTDIDLFYDLGY